MAKKTRKQKIYHCDMYYYKNVCPSRGLTDDADIRHDQEGWLRAGRSYCKTQGLTPLGEGGICEHCIEHKHLFRSEPRVLTGRVVDITYYQVKEEGTARTIKAFFTMRSVKRMLGKALNPDEIYGVDTRNGKLIDAPKKKQ